MTLAAGSRVGHFEVVAPIGAGGMGEVYRARDPRLGRDVAIKLLRGDWSADPERVRRFEQEARAAAALNHPNILALYDVGTHEDAPYIVSELLEGQTLRERLRRGPLPTSIDLAIGIASGLAAAHAKGIVHRDLKPENLFITIDNRVKILDFGVAKLLPTPADTSDLTTLAETTPGTMIGTIGYMAPEQVRGQPVDQRADIFAFGAVLCEMVSGERAFRGATPADTAAAILSGEHARLTNSHVGLSRIVDRCLEKVPASRFQSASDLAFALESLATAPAVVHAHLETGGTSRRTWIPWAMFAAAAIAAVGLAIHSFVLSGPTAPPAFRATMLPPPGMAITDRSVAMGAVPARRLSLSPDGLRLAFTAAGKDGVIWLWVRRLDSLTAQRLEGTEGAVYPFWSPDSKYLGFFSEGGGQKSKLMITDVAGGSPRAVCELPSTNATGGTWNAHDVILFGVFGTPIGEIQRVSAGGGSAAQPATRIDTTTGETRHYAPYFLPDGRHFVYLAVGVKGESDFTPNGVYVGSLDSRDRTLLMPGGSTAKYASGYLLFVRPEGKLMAQSLDLSSLTLQGEPVLVADQLFVSGPTNAAAAFSVSTNGNLVYQGGSQPPAQLRWLNRKGEVLSTLGDPGFDGHLALSPDGSRVALSSLSSDHDENADLWFHDLTLNARNRFTFDSKGASWPVFSPDGSRVVFSTNRTQVFDLYIKPSNGLSREELLLAGGHSEMPMSWSVDGHILYEKAGATTGEDLWVLRLSDRKTWAFADSGSSETQGRFSPDGHFVAYVSDESRNREVYVAPFPGPGEKMRVSINGGSAPVWVGSEIFYVSGNRLIAAQVQSDGKAVRVLQTTTLFDMRPRLGLGRFYDVSRDGQRILVNALVETGEQPVTLLVNWMASLKR